jgi:hypothetical protein
MQRGNAASVAAGYAELVQRIDTPDVAIILHWENLGLNLRHEPCWLVAV